VCGIFTGTQLSSSFGRFSAFLNNQSVNCHVSIITTGAIPDIASHELTSSIDRLTSVNSSTIQNILSANNTEIPSTDALAQESLRKQLRLNIENSRVSQIMKNVQKIDENKNKTLDINSLMEAFTNYINIVNGKNNKESRESIIGIPINFHTKRLTKGDIVRLLVRKYQTETNASKESITDNTEKESHHEKNRQRNT
jgi:hypothetical protein